MDVVIGSHPHVPQGYEKYNNSFIFYSLGNFYFDTPPFVERDDQSYSVIIKFSKNREINFDVIYHKKENLKIKELKENEVKFDVIKLNSLLGDNYEKVYNKTCIELFKKYYYSYYVMAVKKSFRRSMVSLIKRFQKKKKGNFDFQKLLLLHNIRIESHRFVVQRALTLLYEESREAK